MVGGESSGLPPSLPLQSTTCAGGLEKEEEEGLLDFAGAGACQSSSFQPQNRKMWGFCDIIIWFVPNFNDNDLIFQVIIICNTD